MGTAGWAQAEADRARIRTVLRAPPDWRAPATTSVPASTTKHDALSAAPAADQVMRIQASPPIAAVPLATAVQPKLLVGEVNDPFEHEADRVADQVMRLPAPESALTRRHPGSAANARPARRRSAKSTGRAARRCRTGAG